ncbi:TetR family transcriptional regulator [Actinomycetospora sp. NBRC 106375]|uniref:TetR/AcrR family transcriptional regulator n=1 Tax=Actinomycetospora sp. NBRC 106375 TaxID=3032207 RepID=UPI0024A23723|nr:TetR/AcrR family transcriptional regulator [Actinomycetospora sp. NBRC 106375]GLZ46741.1 TetR family transcriptional regulator [Actinomycetospora sp. NBRC 106375]
MRADARRNHDQLLVAARAVVGEHGAEASLREVARRAGVGLGTLYRHFPTRDALLEGLLRTEFDALAARAAELGTAASPREALVTWLREGVAWTVEYRGATELMVAAIEDPDSALHASCVAMRAAGTGLLTRAQEAGAARADLDGTDLFALISAMAWLGAQPALAPRADHLLDVVVDAVCAPRS